MNDDKLRVGDLSIRLRGDLRVSTWLAVRSLCDQPLLPEVDEKALTGLKFAEALPHHLAIATLANRLADLDHASTVLAEPLRFEHDGA